MPSRTHIGVSLGLALGLGCTLLTPYPLLGEIDSIPGGVEDDDDGHENQMDLFSPPEDDDICVTRGPTDTCGMDLGHLIIGHPGQPFSVNLQFDTPKRNVLGGGIRVQNSDSIQWTLIKDIDGLESGYIDFAYVIPNNICESAQESLERCHSIDVDFFAVADGGDLGPYAVSPPLQSTIVLKCAPCSHLSCEQFTGGECQECPPARACRDLYEDCLEPNPNVSAPFLALFDAIYGSAGASWNTPPDCAKGTAFCEGGVQNLLDLGLDLDPTCAQGQG